MKTKMFGHRVKRKHDTERTPGQPYNSMDYDKGDENEESHDYVESKDSFQKEKGTAYGKSKQGPPGYEGKEHVKYQDPGYSSHHIKFPEDEPHMKSHVNRNEEHEAEDDFHRGIPDQTHYDLAAKIKRAKMKMDDPHQEDPKPLRGNMVHNEPYKGDIDTTGEEQMGPNDMQMPKEHRKKMIVAVMKRKMKKHKEE